MTVEVTKEATDVYEVVCQHCHRTLSYKWEDVNERRDMESGKILFRSVPCPVCRHYTIVGLGESIKREIQEIVRSMRK